jgi:hypothetical protein
MKSFAVGVLWFIAGAVVTAAPFVICGTLDAADEAARGEPTMGPGITTFLGLLAAPFGGGVTVLVATLIRRARSTASQRSPTVG